MYEDVCYKKSFLKQVISKVEFASPLTQVEKGVPNKLISAFIKSFPIVEPADMLMHELAMEGDGLKAKNPTSFKQWSFFSKDRQQQLAISPQAVFIEYKNYTTYEDTKAQFGTVVDALNANFPGTLVSRFGLRYINQIDLPLDDPTAWNTYVDPRLVGVRDFFVVDEGITRLVSVVELKYGDVGVRFQLGMPNPDYPAQIKRPVFVLDLDASVSQAHDLNDVMAYMDEGHGRIQALFERSITQALREKMNAKPVQE